MSDASREDLAANAHFETTEDLRAAVARLREELAAAKGEAKHWCDHATKLVSDLIRADDLRATAVADLAAARRSLEEARAERDMWKRRAEMLLGRRGGMGQGQVADFALAPPAPTPPPCASWCGKAARPNDGRRADTPYWRHPLAGSAYFCTPACRDAGAPRNPG